MDCLARERHFEISRYLSRTTFGGIKGDHLVAFEELLKYGGVVVWFVSPGTSRMIETFNSQEFLEYCHEDLNFKSDRIEEQYSDLSNDSEALDSIEEADNDPYEHVFQIFVRVEPSIPSDWTAWLPMLRHESPMIDAIGEASPAGVDWSSADDLMVRIYEGKFSMSTVADRFRKAGALIRRGGVEWCPAGVCLP